MPGLVEKGLNVTRSGTKKAALELSLLYVEVENTAEGVISDLLKALDAKQPKLVAASVGIMKEIVLAYGVKVLGDVKAVIGALNKIFAHSDKAVRSEGSLLAQALYQYLGPALTPSLSDLKPVQLKELQEIFASIDSSPTPGGSGKPTRFTRTKTREMEAAAASQAASGGSGTAEQVEEEEEEVIDPLAFVDAAELSKVFPENFLESMSSTKWKDKQEACLAASAALVNLPKVKDDPSLSEYAQSLAKKMSDTNVIVVTVAANLIAGLAKAVENRGFGKYRSILVTPILDRTKERKATVIEALAGALDAIFSVTSIGENLEDCVAALSNKNPQVKEQSLRFMARMLASTKIAPSKGELKTMAEAQISQLGESVEPVRAAAAEGLGNLMKIFGERALNPFMENVNDLQRAKVTDAMEKAEVKCKPGGAASAPATRAAPPMAVASAPTPRSRPIAVARPTAPSSAAAGGEGFTSRSKVTNSPPLKRTNGMYNFDDESAFSAPTPTRAPPPKPVARPVASAPPSRFAAKKPAPAPSRPTVSASSTKGKGGGSAPPPNDQITYKYTQEDAEAQAADLVPSEIRSGLADSAWKTRVEAAENLSQWVQGVDVDSELLVRFFAKSPGWNEKIAQVSSKIFEILGKVAESNPSFGRSSAALAIPPLSEKLGDIKLKKLAGDALIIFAEKTSLGFVLSQIYEPLGKLKAPKAQQDALAWLKQALTDFGIKGLALRELVQFLKTNLQSANGGVRSSATATLVTLRLFVGADGLASFLEDLNPQLQTTINNEFAKVDSQTPPEPTKQSAELLATQSLSSASGAGEASASGGDALDDLIPRIDLDKLVAQTTVLADSKSDSWKVRKEAFESLLGVLEVKSNSRLQGNMGEIGSVLKVRLADSNLSVKMCCLAIVSKISGGMGPLFQPHARLLTTPVANVLADNKVTTRSSSIDTLNAVADACEGLETMILGFATSTETNNPALRGSILGFVAGRLDKAPASKSLDLQPLLTVTLASLEDRNGDVRKAAQALLPHLVANVGYNAVMDKVSGMKAASKSTITPLVQSARVNLANSGASVTAAAPPADKPLVKSAIRPLAREVAPSPGRPSILASTKATDPRMRSMQTKTNALRGPAAVSTNSMEPEESLPKPVYRSKLSAPRTLLGGKSSNPPPTDIPVMMDKPALPLHTTDNDPRLARAKRDLVRWQIDTTSSAQLLEYLQKQMEGHASMQLQMMLFSKDRAAEKDHMAGLLLLDDMYTPGTTTFDADDGTLQAAKLANIDLAIKYASLRLHDGSTQMVLKCLDLVGHIVEFMDTTRAKSGAFSEAEANCLLPALIFRLGDNKFKEKLQVIFHVIDRTIPGSKIIQFYVDRGVASANSKTRAAAMEMLAQLIKRRGDVAAGASNGSRLYKKIGEQIASADPATRSAALDCIAYLFKYTGQSVLSAIGELKPKEKDLLNNRIDKLVAPVARTLPSAAHLRAGTPTKSASASPVQSPNGVGSNHTSPRSRTSAEYGTGRPSPPRQNDGPGDHGVNASAIPVPRAPPPSVASSGIGRSQALRTLQRLGQPSNPRPSGSEVDQMLEAIPEEDPDVSVDALKIAQHILEVEPERMEGRVEALLDGVTLQWSRMFAVQNALEDPKVFRLAKHLVQTLSNLCDRALLVESVSVVTMSALLEQLTLGLISTDQANSQVKEMSKFINLTILRIFASSTQITMFDALFQLLLRRTQVVTAATSPESMAAKHADLVLKCIWKRSRTAVDDMKKGYLSALELFQVLERFLQVIPPKSWRQRGVQKIPPGDMPLRTVKVLIQHVICEFPTVP